MPIPTTRRPGLVLACAGVVGVAHSRAPGVGGDCGIMRNSNVGSGRGPAPMCVDPPHCTWEPGHRARRSPEDPVIPTKTSPRPAEPLVSHVQHRGKPRPLTHHAPSRPPHRPVCSVAENKRRPPHPLRRSQTPPQMYCTRQSRRGLRPISSRKWTDLEAEVDRSRCGVRPISAYEAPIPVTSRHRLFP